MPVVGVISYPPIPIWDLGPFRLSLHGVFAAVGFMVGAVLATREMRGRGLDTEAYQSALTWGLFGALVGARYLTSPAAVMAGQPVIDALNPFNGSFSIMGGFAGGIVGGIIRMRQVGLPILPTLDASTFGLAIGTAVGRIGDLAIVEHLGRATAVPWGYGIKPGYDVAPQHDLLECVPGRAVAGGLCPVPPLEGMAGAVEPGAAGIYHHVAAYDLAGAAVLLGVLYLVSRLVPLHPGQLFYGWVAWYGLQRFVLDALRFGNGDATIGGLTWNQVSGLTAGICGLVLIGWVGLRTKSPQTLPSDGATV